MEGRKYCDNISRKQTARLCLFDGLFKVVEIELLSENSVEFVQNGDIPRTLCEF